MGTDYYATLGLKKAATSEEIHKAYRELARKYHPDLHPDDANAKKKFQEVQAAFDVLNDPKKREMYDQYGPGFESLGGTGGPYRAHPWQGAGGEGQTFHFDFEDLFNQAQTQSGGGGGSFADFFRNFTAAGRGRPGGASSSSSRHPLKGDDIEHDLSVPFASAVLGGQAQIAVQRPNGRTETITVKIPAGIEDGKKIRLRGQGESGPRGRNGDLLIRVHVSDHPCFRRRGKQLEVTVPISLAEAIAGAKIDVPTPRGTITLQIPPGTSSGKRLRIKGHGIHPTGKPPGDLYAEVQIVLPDRIDEADRKRIAELASRYPLNPRKDLRW
ncbi:MAG: DnaJ domain-containing protein [Pirellulales bacterium]|nr:DnaJ domain-containing protein [Pirellulales bacterium]